MDTQLKASFTTTLSLQPPRHVTKDEIDTATRRIDFDVVHTGKRAACPTIFDVTHSLQQSGGCGNTPDGEPARKFALTLARAACAVGVVGALHRDLTGPGQRALRWAQHEPDRPDDSAALVLARHQCAC